MSWRHGILATSVRASACILLVAASIIGALELVDQLATTSAPAEISPQPWAPLGALTGVLRLALLAALGVAVTAVATGLTRRVHPLAAPARAARR